MRRIQVLVRHLFIHSFIDHGRVSLKRWCFSKGLKEGPRHGDNSGNRCSRQMEQLIKSSSSGNVPDISEQLREEHTCCVWSWMITARGGGGGDEPGRNGGGGRRSAGPWRRSRAESQQSRRSGRRDDLGVLLTAWLSYNWYTRRCAFLGAQFETSDLCVRLQNHRQIKILNRSLLSVLPPHPSPPPGNHSWCVVVSRLRPYVRFSSGLRLYLFIYLRMYVCLFCDSSSLLRVPTVWSFSFQKCVPMYGWIGIYSHPCWGHLCCFPFWLLQTELP